jgi:mannose-6-phosphate isomerase-like protein (cupin superfamily)
MTGQLIEDPVLRQRYRFETVGDVLHIEVWVDPGGGVPPHVHPAMEERFTVVEGRPELLAGRRWTAAGPGEVVVVPPGTRHAFRNRGDAVVHMRTEATPASTLEAFLTEVAALSQAGKISPRGLPTSPRAAIEAVAVAHRHRDMVVLGFPFPPAPVQRLLFPRLARLA